MDILYSGSKAKNDQILVVTTHNGNSICTCITCTCAYTCKCTYTQYHTDHFPDYITQLSHHKHKTPTVQKGVYTCNMWM